ncbi:MAG: prepilin-type N-terminal cleavage/methylation domain-containing protein [Akkermansiaceae bacterium]
MKMTKHNMAKGFTLVELLVVIAIIAALAALSTPVVLKQQKKAAATEAVNNAKQHFILLFEFDQDNGQYPGSSETMSTGAVAPSSNQAFREFFIANQIDAEDIFYAKTGWTSKPDGDIGTAAGNYAQALEAGECGFNYFLEAANDAFGTSNASATPLVATPAIDAGFTGNEFNINAFGGRAVVLFNDGACKSLPITEGATAGQGVVNITVAGAPVELFSAANPALAAAPVTLPAL